MKKQEKKSNKIVFFAFLSFAIFIACAVISCLLLFHHNGQKKESVSVPMLVGLNFEDVPKYAQFTIKSEGVFSSSEPEGVIISQSPYGGASRKLSKDEKCEIIVRVSLGEKRNRIPNLRHYDYLEATGVLRSLGARVKIVSRYDTDEIPDKVLLASPDFGEEIKEGDTVTLYVSRRHTHSSVRVQNFCRMSKECAVERILESGLFIGEISLEYSKEIEEGRVMEQSVPEGALVPYGSKISLKISLGEKKEEKHPFREGD